MKLRSNRVTRFLGRHQRPIVIWAVIIVSGIMVLRGIMQYPQISRNFSQAAALTKRAEDEKARRAEIDDLREKVNTDEYIERIAKEKLGLVKSNAKIFKDISENE